MKLVVKSFHREISSKKLVQGQGRGTEAPEARVLDHKESRRHCADEDQEAERTWKRPSIQAGRV